MSFQEEWVLPQPVDSYSSDDLLRRVRGLLPDGIEITISGESDNRTIHVSFATTAVEAIAAKLSKRDGQLDWDWRGDMDPPRPDGDVYDVHVDIVDDERPILRIYSNDGENRQAWPLAFSIAASLAEDLGAIPEEDAPPPSDRIPMFVEPGKASKPN
jgi:hypothetical protein